MESESTLPTVFIIDDDDNDRMLAQSALIRVGVPNPIQAFATGSEFIGFVQAASTALGEEARIPGCVVFLDLRMPPPDGFDILRWIRTQPSLAHLQVVILTGSVDPQNMRLAAQLRADLYLPKFPSDETLARIVNKASASAQQAMRFAALR